MSRQAGVLAYFGVTSLILWKLGAEGVLITRASDGVTMIWLFNQILFDVIVLDWRNLIAEFLHLLWDYIYCCYMMVLNFLPLRLSCKESSTFSPSPSSSGSGDVTALRCSEPLRSKVGGPSKVFAMSCGMGPPY